VIPSGSQTTARDQAPGLFAATHWSIVLQAKAKSETALESLCSSYRAPLLVYLRDSLQKHGQSAQDAEDLLQGFFAHLLTREFLQNVGPEKGKFRTFLLVSLKNYLRDEHSRNVAQRRGSGRVIESLQATDDSGQPLHDPAAQDVGPDRDYDRAWARALLSNSLARLEQECRQAGHSALFSALEPVMFADETALPYRESAEKLSMSEGALKVAAHRIRSRLKGLIREEVQQTVTNTEEWEEEVRYLVSLFGK
jgi:RNA polymerase sigma-70 factor (ECF subfamily)